MKSRKKLFSVLVVSLVLIEGIFIFLSYKSLNMKEEKIDNVNLLDDKKIEKNNMFAIMLQQDDGTYKESSSSLWPTDMKYNEELSGCIDKTGATLTNALTYDSTNNLATVTTAKSAYCYLYFDIGKTDTEKLIENVSGDVLWQSTLENDGYRYVGTNPNNYICFGTTDKSTCTGNTDKYMYRIIGIFEDEEGQQHLKLIKKEIITANMDDEEYGYMWHSDYQTDIDWDESDLYNKINGDTFLRNTTYVPTGWSDKIAEWNYTATNTKTYENYSTNGSYGVYYYNYNTVSTIYLHEMNRSSKSNCYYNASTSVDCNIGEWKPVSAKIGLMYVSDYLLSLGSSALGYKSYDNRTTLKTGWMHISNNDSDAYQYEWTISRYGANSNGLYGAWFVNSSGYVNWRIVNVMYSVRPVFYLTSDVKISGEGTTENPYMIS